MTNEHQQVAHMGGTMQAVIINKIEPDLGRAVHRDMGFQLASIGQQVAGHVARTLKWEKVW